MLGEWGCDLPSGVSPLVLVLHFIPFGYGLGVSSGLPTFKGCPTSFASSMTFPYGVFLCQRGAVDVPLLLFCLFLRILLMKFPIF